MNNFSCVLHSWYFWDLTDINSLVEGTEIVKILQEQGKESLTLVNDIREQLRSRVTGTAWRQPIEFSHVY